MPSASPVDWISAFVSQHGLGVGLIAVFIGGLLLNLTPCVYPMLPITFAFFTGQARGAVKRAVGLAACYVLGIALSYAILGAVAASTGALLGSWLQQPLVLISAALVITALALSMFGLYDLRPPQALTRHLGKAPSGLWGAWLMGMMVGVIAAPCIGPFVLGLFVLSSQLGNPAMGFLLFFVLGLGMGFPYLLLGVGAARVGQLPKAGEWLVWSKKGLGLVLLGLTLYFLRPLLPPQILRLAVTGLLLGGGVYLGWITRSKSHGPAFRAVRMIVGGTLVLSAVVVAWPRPQTGASVAWAPFNLQAMEQAQRDGRPMVIDVYADWCLPCVEMDHVTFRHPDVVSALAAVATLRLDVTREVPPDGQVLVERYRIFGAPTVMLFDRTGHEREELRLLGFASPDEFLDLLARIQ